MMNHHPPPLPHGQPPVPPPRRQIDMPYPAAPPNVRSSSGYMGYPPHGHATGPMPPYPPPPPFQQPWYPYPMQHAPPHPPPHPQAYPPYSPLIVSSYPRPSHPAAAAPPPPHPAPTPPTSSTPQLSTFSSTPPLQVSTSASEVQEDAPTALPAGMRAKESDDVSTSSGAILTPVSTSTQVSASDRAKHPPTHIPFLPPLPWLSVPNEPFPKRLPRRRRKARIADATEQSVVLSFKNETNKATLNAQPLPVERPSTPTTSHPTSESVSTELTTPSPTNNAPAQCQTRQVPVAHARQSSQANILRPVIPVVPVVPVLPTSPTKRVQEAPEKTVQSAKVNGSKETDVTNEQSDEAKQEQQEPKSPSQPRPQFKSWADLVRTKKPSVSSPDFVSSSGIGGVVTSKTESLVDVINSLASEAELDSNKIAFVEPRGLVNTGNMCYMNSILQVLVFCIPFYDFLDRLSRRAAHSFKSELPLLDAMIMFLREFRVIDSATSVEQLKLRLKQNELEQYGASFTPEYVYQVIRHLPRFRDMRRGHQQDAQEFLGFLFEELHEECLHAIKLSSSSSENGSVDGAETGSTTDTSNAEGWLEVGHKQKAAVTRSSGHTSAESPITRIFGGKIRSEFRVPGNKNSVTLEPYQSLQLDIGSPQVNNIIDALKGLTRPETMHGDFSSSRGTKVNATKQVFIESLPPVLILHLKRFHYDSATKGTQKIWKKIGYPLDLEIPKEVFAPHRRNMITAQGGGLPRYRLTGVIYHHGKNASGGHYTVELRRQDGREWIRIDDTVIRRVRSDDVAYAGSDEDPKAVINALEQQKAAENASQPNIFRHFDQDEDQDNDREWNQVNNTGSSHASKKSISASANGAASPISGDSSGKRTPNNRLASRENKVAYLLFYERI